MDEKAALRLFGAIATYVKERESHLTKTKLLKLLYLFDVEYYREHGSTYTGFSWKFFHLGPWAAEFDPILTGVISEGALIEYQANYGTSLYKPGGAVSLSSVFPAIKDEFILKRVLRLWGDSSTGEILNDVYFSTEPMEHAVRNEALDFTSIQRRGTERYVRPSSGIDPVVIESKRKEFEARRSKTSIHRDDVSITPPRYDAEYFEALDIIDSL